MVKAVRGAVQIEADEKNLIQTQVKKMIDDIVSLNNIDKKDIASIFFTITADLRSLNPATAVRAGGDWGDVPLFCAAEPDTDGAMPRVIRTLIMVNGMEEGSTLRHVYLGGAERLRPDLS